MLRFSRKPYHKEDNMNTQEFHQHCSLVGRWLEESFRPKEYSFVQDRWCNVEGNSSYAVRLRNKAIADIAWPIWEGVLDCPRVSSFSSTLIKYGRNVASFNIPVPEKEVGYWKNMVDQLSKKIKNLRLKRTCENHLNVDYWELPKRALANSLNC